MTKPPPTAPVRQIPEPILDVVRALAIRHAREDHARGITRFEIVDRDERVVAEVSGPRAPSASA